MHYILILVVSLFLVCSEIYTQTRKSSETEINKNKVLKSNEVREAFEIESLIPMFFYGGYHYCIGYRYEKFRLRVSIINGGKYNAEPAGLKNTKDDFKRYYKISPGLFLGYNVWKNLELYTFLEMHNFQIEEKSSGQKGMLKSTDFGGGISYQLFIGRYFYFQPGLHMYLRSSKELQFVEQKYKIPNIDFSPVIRIGFRLLEKF